MQDTQKTLDSYRETLYPTLHRLGINHIVEDNESPHNNVSVTETMVSTSWGTPYEKVTIVELIRDQTHHYRREQDKRAQLTKQTREFDRLPAWPPNSPDLNLVEVVWSWMVKAIKDSDEGWPSDQETLKTWVVAAWDAIPIESFRELCRSYRIRLQAIHSVDGGRHPQFA